MRVLFLVLFFTLTLFGDFYIVSGTQKVKMTPLQTGVIDFSTFGEIAKIQRGNSELHAYGEEIAFNHKHLNFRLATITLPQTNYTIGEWSKKAQNKSDEYYINFNNYTREDGVMLQLFYKNKWYAAVLGEPLEILHTLFATLDSKNPDLDVAKAIEAIAQARAAFPSDEALKKSEIALQSRYTDDLKMQTKHKQEKVEFPKKL